MIARSLNAHLFGFFLFFWFFFKVNVCKEESLAQTLEVIVKFSLQSVTVTLLSSHFILLSLSFLIHEMGQ